MEEDLPSSAPALFDKVDNYPFHSDIEFKAGLGEILGHPKVPASEEEVNREDDLVLQAKLFYVAR
jgi:hypothetical protein